MWSPDAAANRKRSLCVAVSLPCIRLLHLLYALPRDFLDQNIQGQRGRTEEATGLDGSARARGGRVAAEG